MDKDEINYLLLYKKPISECILEYATDNFTKNNAHKLIELNEDNHKGELLLVINELIEWYQTSIESIKKDRFILNKEDHMRSYDMLQCIKTQLSSQV